MIKNFNEDEKKALIAVAKFIANQDNKLTAAELGEFKRISEQEGFEDFHEIFKAVDKEVRTLKDLSHVINKVTRTQIREEIVALAIAMAEADGFESPAEHDAINYLCRVWNISVENLKPVANAVLVTEITIMIRGAN